MTIAATIGALNANIEANARANALIHVAKYLVAAKGSRSLAREMAEQRRALPNIQAVLKAAVDAGTTTGTTWAAPVSEYSGMVAAFVDSLANFGAFDAALPMMKRMPLRTRVAIVTVGATAATVSQGSIVPISSLALDGQQLAERKAVVILAGSEELFKLAGAEAAALFGRELRSAVAIETDREFFRLIADGVAPITSSGSTVAAVRNDLGNALRALGTDMQSRLFVVVTPRTAKAWAAMGGDDGSAFPGMRPDGGSIMGMPALVTDGVDDDQVIVFDANQIAAGAGTFEFDTARHTTLQLETVPDSPPADAAILTSLWQNDMSALKAQRYFGAERLRDAAVAVIEGVEYDLGNSPS